MAAVFTATVIARHSGKAVSVNGEGEPNGAKLVEWADTDKPHQQFRLG